MQISDPFRRMCLLDPDIVGLLLRRRHRGAAWRRPSRRRFPYSTRCLSPNIVHSATNGPLCPTHLNSVHDVSHLDSPLEEAKTREGVISLQPIHIDSREKARHERRTIEGMSVGMSAENTGFFGRSFFDASFV